MIDSKPSEEKMRQAKLDYQVLETRLARYLVRKPVKAAHSTAGQWESPSTEGAGPTCRPGSHCLREL